MLCGVEKEGTFRASVTCGHARILWDAMRAIWPLPSNEQHYMFWQTALYRCVTSDMVIILIWRIWQLRTDMVHGKTVPLVEVLISCIAI